MKLQLILAGPYEACINTQQIWQDACEQYQQALEVFDLESKEGQELEQKLNIKSFPALIVDQQVKAVGHPDRDAAARLIAGLVE